MILAGRARNPGVHGMGQGIGLNPDDIRVPDQVQGKAQVPLNEADVALQHRADHLQPGGMAAEDDRLLSDFKGAGSGIGQGWLRGRRQRSRGNGRRMGWVTDTGRTTSFAHKKRPPSLMMGPV